MSIQLNHTIVWCRDKQKASAFLVAQADSGVSLDYSDDLYADRAIEPQPDGHLVRNHHATVRQRRTGMMEPDA